MTTATTEQRVNADWKACMPKMEQAFGKVRTDVLLRRLIPLEYSGDTLVLGAPSEWHCQHVTRHFTERLQRILGRPVRIVASAIARNAESRLKAKADGTR